MFTSDFISLSKDSPVKDEYGSLTWKVITRNGSIAGAVSLSSDNAVSTLISNTLSNEETIATKCAIGDILCEHISRILLLKDVQSGYRAFNGAFAKFDDSLTNFYYLKRYVLIAQNYFNNDLLDFSFEDVEPRPKPDEEFAALSEWCARRIRTIQTIVPKGFIDSFEENDEGKFPNGKMMREIPNDAATDVALGVFVCMINSLFKTKSNMYQLVLHDFADEEICFDTSKDAGSFLHHFACYPYTLYKREGFNSRTEVKSYK